MPNPGRKPGLVSLLAGACLTLLLLGCTGDIIGGLTPPAASPNPPARPGDRPITPASSAPGVSQLRRLTVLEYRNTLRDLLGVSDAPMLELAGDQQARTSGYTTGAAITTVTDARRLLEGTEKLAQAALPNLAAQVPCLRDAAAAEPCAREFIVQFGRRAFRRPLVDEEIARWLGLYQAQRDPDVAASFPEAIVGVTVALLQSPNFLYRRELAPGAAITEGDLVRFNSYEMASRLSYSFWASMPDERLFALADAGKLQSPGIIQDEARRLLIHPRARDVYGDFAAQWLNLAQVASAQKATDLNFTPEVGRAMLTATALFFADLFMAPGTTGRMDQLFTSRRTFADETLARLYGIQGVTGSALSPVTLDPKQRSGLLTQLTFLTMHGDAEGSFPARRGAEIARRILCHEIDIPPDMEIPDVKPPTPGVTTRQRFEEHAQNPCASCHLLLDPLGFAFENYDGIGRYRTTDSGQPVDASGTLHLGSGPVTFENAIELMPALAASEEVGACLATQWMRYLIRREETKGDMPSLQAVQKTFRDSSYDLRELLVAIVGSDAFLRRTPAAGEVLP